MIAFDPLTNKPIATNTYEKTQSPDNIASNATSMRGQDLSASTARRGQDISAATAGGSVTYHQDANGNYVALPTKPGSGASPSMPMLDGKPIAGKASKGGSLSATAQKELFEANDTVQASANVVEMLTRAKTLSKDAYEGVGAKQRAAVTSNTFGSKSADATVDLDNITTGQALESLRSVFGGSPTEGERKILLDIQGSANMTKKQRETIYDRAIELAKRRQNFNQNKAKSIRDGSYFSEDGASPQPFADSKSKTTQLPGGFEVVHD